MKIVNKSVLTPRLTAQIGALLLTIASAPGAYAAGNPTPMPTPVAPNLDEAMAPLPIAAAPNPGGTPGAEISKTVSAMENKISDGAKGVIKNLDASTDAMTLEDLNSARQTVARIEAIIDVEKHLAELEKLRNDRTGIHSSSSLAGVIPASALQPLPAMTRPTMPVEREMPRPVVVNSLPEIARIVGSEGRYSAVLKVNGDFKTVRVGDQVSGGTTVKYISSSSVVLDENGQTRTLRVKNVDAIYSAMR